MNYGALLFLYVKSVIQQQVTYAAVALSILTLILPTLMVMRVRKIEANKTNRYRVKGGTPALLIVLTCGVAVILIQIGIVSGMLRLEQNC